jgi:hypothetical protein
MALITPNQFIQLYPLQSASAIPKTAKTRPTRDIRNVEIPGIRKRETGMILEE